jgi:hypothetical protein
MRNITRLGDLDIAGSERHPVTFRVISCPRCYGVLYWTKKYQESTQCEQCGNIVYMNVFDGPIGYARHMIRSDLFSLQTLIFVVYALFQVIDYRLGLRKILLYLYIRGLSYL